MQNDLKDWFGDTVNSKDFQESTFIDRPKDIQSRIENIINKNNSLYASAEKAWSDLTPFLWEKAVLKRDYR